MPAKMYLYVNSKYVSIKKNFLGRFWSPTPGGSRRINFGWWWGPEFWKTHSAENMATKHQLIKNTHNYDDDWREKMFFKVINQNAWKAIHL